jgi:hypothetical protein
MRRSINPTSEGALLLLDMNISRTPAIPRLTRVETSTVRQFG